MQFMIAAQSAGANGVLGVLFALIIVFILVKKLLGVDRCQFCGKSRKSGANVCHHCGRAKV